MLILVVIVLYGIPASLVILLLYNLLKKKSGKENALKLRNRLFAFLGLVLIILMFFDWYTRRHWIDFQFNEKYELSIIAIETDSFLDAPTTFKLRFRDVSTDELICFEVYSGKGPQLKFMRSENNQDLAVIKGYDFNENRYWVIDLKNKSIVEEPFEGDLIESAKPELHYELEENISEKERIQR